MEDTWTNRDLPVLEAIVQMSEADAAGFIDPAQIAQLCGLAESETQSALRALNGEVPPFVTDMRTSASGHIFLVGAPTGQARRAVGAWPTPESLADRLVRALDEAADREPDEERKGFLRKTASYLGNAGRDLAVEIGATAINRQMGM